MPAFQSLADELIELIICSVERPHRTHESASNLRNLCLTSRDLNRITKPILFRHIEHNGFRDHKLPALLLQTIESDGTNAELIKSITYKGPCFRHHEGCTHRVSEPTLIRRIAEALELPDCLDLEKRFREQDEGLELAMIILQTPNLEKLDVRSWKLIHWRMMPLWLTVLSYVARGTLTGGIHSFSSLTHLYVDAGSVDTVFLYPLFLLPSLTDLTLCHWGRYPISDHNHWMTWVHTDPWVWPVRSNKIAHLSFKLPWVPPAVMSNVIRSCNALKSFECHLISPRGIRQEGMWYNGISKALIEHYATLTQILVSEFDYGPDQCNDFGVLGPLHIFQCLQVLRIPLTIVTGVYAGARWIDVNYGQQFPPTLETLVLELEQESTPGDYNDFFQRLQASCGANQLPCLKKIELRCRFSEFPLPIDISVLDIMFQPFGVQFEYYIQVWYCPNRTSLNIRNRMDEEDNVLTPQQNTEVQNWVNQLRLLPRVSDVRQEFRNMVAISSGATPDDPGEKRYEKQLGSDMRWRVY